MIALKNMNILKSIVPINSFNEGKASQIFSEVKNDGIRVVVKNNIPECVLISPKDYQNMLDEYENTLLLVEATKRASENVEPISQEDIL